MKKRWVSKGLAIALALGVAAEAANANGFGDSQSGAQETIQRQDTAQNVSLGSTGIAEQFGNIANLSMTGASHLCEPLLSGTTNSIFAYGEVDRNNVIVDYNNPNREPSPHNDSGENQQPPAPATPQRPEILQIVPVTETPSPHTGKHNPTINPVPPSAIRDAWRRPPKKERPN